MQIHSRSKEKSSRSNVNESTFLRKLPRCSATCSYPAFNRSSPSLPPTVNLCSSVRGHPHFPGYRPRTPPASKLPIACHLLCLASPDNPSSLGPSATRCAKLPLALLGPLSPHILIMCFYVSLINTVISS